MPLFTLTDATLDAPIAPSRTLSQALTLRDALGFHPTLIAFVRHLG